METDAVHYLASSTKLITTIAVMQCVERGLLDLDANVAQVLPEWEAPQVLTGFDDDDQPIFRPSTKVITLRHLLTHTSGMAYVYMEPLLTRYARLPIAEPRNPNSIVERVSSMRLGDYMKRHIFDIVSVKDATFHLENREDLRARLAKVWERAGGDLRVAEKTPWADPVEEDLGGGGLYATVSDLLKICHGILNGKLLRLESVRAMFQPQLKTSAGLENQPDHSSSYRNAVYNAWIDLEKGVAGVYLSQLTPTGDQQAVKLLAEFEKFVYQKVKQTTSNEHLVET
ncbi:hypothetical protein ARSEF1564_008459 [Beauveria bassiana]